MSAYLWSRLHKECHLLKYYWWRIILLLTCVMYFCSVVARNIAFTNHHPLSYYVDQKNESLVRIKRLEDIGFQILPDWSNSSLAKNLNDVIAVLSLISVILFSILTLLSKRATKRKVFSINIIVRFAMCYVTAHFIRTCVYLTTSLPGPAVHCIDAEMEQSNKPKSLWDIFFSMKFDRNCGDLLYSGHMAGYITGFCTVVYYIEKIFHNDKKFAKWQLFQLSTPTLVVTIIYTLDMISQMVLAIGTRQHYTVDVLLAILAGYGNFIWHLHVVRPFDMDTTNSAFSDLKLDESNSSVNENIA